MIYVHKEGKVAEYTRFSGNQHFDITRRPDGDVWFENKIYLLSGMPDNWFDSKEEAYKAAMNYHETEGCALYLELYPAPDKGNWAWIAQDCDGRWMAYAGKPEVREFHGGWSGVSLGQIKQSPPNPFWRKTLR